MAPRAGTEIQQPIAWRAASPARRPLTGAHARMGVPVGEGVRSATLRTIKRRSTPGAGSRRFRPRLRSSAPAQTARSRVVRSGRELGHIGDARLSKEQR
jgi:hypothetical protein